MKTHDKCPEVVPGAFSRQCITDTDNIMVKGEGTVFASAGVGGVGMYNVNAEDPEAGFSPRYQNRNPAEGTLDATATDERLTVRFVPAADCN